MTHNVFYRQNIIPRCAVMALKSFQIKAGAWSFTHISLLNRSCNRGGFLIEIVMFPLRVTGCFSLIVHLFFHSSVLTNYVVCVFCDVLFVEDSTLVGLRLSKILNERYVHTDLHFNHLNLYACVN